MNGFERLDAFADAVHGLPSPMESPVMLLSMILDARSGTWSLFGDIMSNWQAIQFYRGEWLLGATTSFVAGILLKKSNTDSK